MSEATIENNPTKEDLIRTLEQVLEDKEYSEDDKKTVLAAYAFADEKHTGQLRASGEEFIIHPICVGTYLAEMNADVEMILTGLLHDVVEDTDATVEDITSRYGESVSLLVNGVTKISKLKASSKQEQKAETIRKMLFAMIQDIRVIIIKLADKIHNMSTLEFLNREKQKRIAKEVLQIYAPLAGRLGLTFMRYKLENLALKALQPDIYSSIKEYVANMNATRVEITKLTSRKMAKELDALNITYEIKSRTKHYFSIYKKMKKFNKQLDSIFDLTGVRIITDTVENCYIIFGIIHRLWRPVDGRFKDYIANPKKNGYSSLHTTVIIGKRRVVEFQIRTFEMQEMNEYGIAAHWYYKKGTAGSADANIKWLQNLKSLHEKGLHYQDYYDTIRNEILREEIYVFTPKGDVKELPKGSTPLDFAYLIHTEVGHRCKGAKANGNIIPLHAPLKNGMIVDIITGKEANPKREWISIANTASAKRKIRHYFRVLEENKKEQLQDNKKNAQEEKKEKKPKIKVPARKSAANKKKGNKVSIEIDGEKNVLFTYAKCCKPKPPTPIIGYISRGRGIIIHRQDCKSIQQNEGFEERQIHVNWSLKFVHNIYSFYIKAINIQSVYLSIDGIVKRQKGKIVEYDFDPNASPSVEIEGAITIEVPANKNIDLIINEIQRIKSVLFIDKI